MNLPVELYEPIFQHVSSDHATLLNLLLVSRSFRSEAERILYHKVTIRYNGRGWNEVNIRLMQTLIRSERIASHVQVLSIIIDDNLPLDISTEPDVHWRPAHQVLRAVKNLKNLTWVANYMTTVYPSFSMLSGTTFQLDRLMFPFRHLIDRPFLEAQHNIMELAITSDEMVNTSQNALPNLAILTASKISSLYLVEGRPVWALKTFCFPTFEWPPSPHFKSVKSLYLRNVALDYLPEIFTRFPSLRYLRLETYSFLPYAAARAAIIAACGQPPTVYKLHLKMTASPPDIDAIFWIFSSVSSLQIIIIDGSSSSEEWIRGAAHAQELPCDTFDDEWKDSRWSVPLERGKKSIAQ